MSERVVDGPPVPTRSTGWPQTGAEVVASFREGMHDRINMRGAAR